MSINDENNIHATYKSNMSSLGGRIVHVEVEIDSYGLAYQNARTRLRLMFHMLKQKYITSDKIQFCLYNQP